MREHGILLTAALAVAVFGGLLVVADGEALVSTLLGVEPRLVAVVVLLVAASYLVRFLKWSYYLGELGIDASPGASLLTFVSGLMMVVTPGKLGEVWKAWFLRDLEGVPASRTAAAVGAERVTDLLALTTFALLGVFLYRRSTVVIVGVGAVLVAGIGLLQWRSACLAVLDRCRSLPLLSGHASAIERFYEGAYVLFGLRPLSVAMVLSLVAWGLEGLVLWIVLDAFGAPAGPLLGLFVFGLGSVVGAISLLPGGLVATEASMVALLVALGIDESVAAGATILVRVGTLWFGAALGAAVFGLHRLRTGLRGNR